VEETTRQMSEMGSWIMEQGLTYGTNIVGAVLILIVGYWIAGRVSNVVRRAVGRSTHIDDTLKPLFASIARYLVLIITLIAVLNQFGVQTASIIAVLGAAGLAIGLALQGTLQNIAAGIMLLILRPFKVGDFIDAGPVAATVDEIGLFVTHFTTVDGVYVSCPNSSIWNSKITNFSRNGTRRMDLVIGVSYDDDIGKAIEILSGLMEKDDRVLKDPAPQCMVTNLGDSSVDITMRLWANSADFWGLQFDLKRWSKERIEAGGLSIPYPQQDVHMRQVAAE
jgi:small conductance mechanosensitive channel